MVEAREQEEALDGAAIAAGWVAVGSDQGENVSARIVVLRFPTREVFPVTRLAIPNAGHR